MATTPQLSSQQDPRTEDPTPWQAAQEEQFIQEQQPITQSQFDTVTWSSAEYIEHDRTPLWYGVFAGVLLAITLFMFFVTNELLAAIAILIVGGSVFFFASRPPLTRTYTLTPQTISIDSRSYELADFTSFAVVQEGVRDSIWLKPNKRFAPMLMIYFEPEDEQKIVEALSSLLPLEERQLDNLDKITRRLKL